ncbi:hypothetical protein MASR1M45_07910 [Candidatus Kapaibacterium sp.]
MDKYYEDVGKRLRQIRHIFNEGGKLSADQFAYLLGESRDRITNYELGRAAVPLRLLHELYLRGISPVFLISGEGPLFADNFNGKNFRTKIRIKLESGTKFSEENYNLLIRSIDYYSAQDSAGLSAAAGKIE